MAKSYLIAFLLWLVLGALGMHHLYLGRDAHFLLTLLTFGGFFGMGWYRDLFHLKQYVWEANLEQRFVTKQAHLMCDNKTPPFSTARFSACVLTAAWFAYAVANAIPQDPELLSVFIQDCLKFALLPLAIALGVYMVGNIGWQAGELKIPLFASYGSFALVHSVASRISYVSFVAALAFELKAKRWKVPRAPLRHRPLSKRIAVIVAVLVVYMALMFSALYFNAKVAWPPQNDTANAKGSSSSNNNKTMPFFQAMRQAYNSQMFRNIILELTIELNKARTSSWSDLFSQLSRYAGNDDLTRAQKILGVNSNATPQNITAAYRKLARLYHPDQHHDPDVKRRAQEMFIELQWAHEFLSGGRGKRSRASNYDYDTRAADEF